MKTGEVLLLAGVGLVAYNLFGKAQFAENVQVIFMGVSVENFNSIIVKMGVQNVTNASVTINSLVGTLLLNGNQVATLSDFTALDIAPNSQTEIDIKVSPDLLSIVSNFSSLISTPGSQLNFNANGSINIASFGIVGFDLDKTVTV